MSASGCSLPRLKTTSLASTPFRRSAWTFSHGIPATFTGQCVTRWAMSRDSPWPWPREPCPGTVPGHGSKLRVPFELVEVAQRGPAGADARRKGAELVVGDLADRALDAEVREVEVLLIDDRRDPRVDLDHVVADELDVEEVLDPELGDDRAPELHQALVGERDEVHGEPGAHALAGLRVAEDDLAPVRDPVDRPLGAGRELHHE